jgi:formylglycine-generating enzyme required for sulfatase activity
VHGNVWEWVEDCWNDTYRDAPSDGSARRGNQCSLRAIRGGSWADDPSKLRAASRDRRGVDYHDTIVGLRVARTLN